MFNLRSFANFLKLRNSELAQKEIKEIAQQMLFLVENIEENPFKHTLEAFKKNEKKQVKYDGLNDGRRIYV
jgi:thymidylate synthase ThyX